MSEEQNQKRGRGVWIAVVFLLVFVVYPLSIGPVFWVTNTSRLPNSSISVLMVVYTPLNWAIEYVPGLESVANWYVDLWR